MQSILIHPSQVSTSIVSHTVTVTHDVSITPSQVAAVLEAAGFDIEKISGDIKEQHYEDDNQERQSIGSSSSRRPILPSRTQTTARDESPRHVESCDMCKRELEEEGPVFTGVHVDSSSGVSQNLAKATFSIEGLTDSSVSNIRDSLKALPWVENVQVSLISNSSEVIFHDPDRLSELKEKIKALGHGTETMCCEKLLTERDHDRATPDIPPELWRGTYAIDGMTCSSCVVTISNDLKDIDWIEDINVNLMTNSATVIAKNKNLLNKAAEKIEDLGYGATLSKVEPVQHTVAEEPSQERQVTIQIEGMHCPRCPERIIDMFAHDFGNTVKVEKPPTLLRPHLKISYIPNSPILTIRKILKHLSRLDSAFRVSIYHPPTLEERSREMHRRHKNLIVRKLVLAVAAAIPTFIIGVVFMNLVPASNTARQYLMEPIWAGKVKRAEWALFIIATPVWFFAADFFHRRALTELWSIWRPGSRTPLLRRFYRFGNMDLLVSLGVTIAYFSSIAILTIDATQDKDGTASETEGTYFDAVTFLTMFLLIGRLLEAISKAKAGDALDMLGKLRPSTAVLVDADSGANTLVPCDQLDFGDRVRIPHGASPPFDGVVVEGKTQFDESSLTGESRMVPKSGDDEVFSGTINKGGPIVITITRVSGNSILDQIISAVREGQTRRAPVERVADVLTGYFVPVITYLAVSVWIIWLVLGLSGSLPNSWLDAEVGGWPFWALEFAVAVFVIACPCGIGLAAPTALFVGGGLAAKYGILVKGGGEAFQEASRLDCIVFDKTGTLTWGGEPAITEHEFLFLEDQAVIMATVKQLEESSSHPLARAMVTFCQNEITHEIQVKKVEEIAGRGMRGSFSVVSGPSSDRTLEVMVGNEALMHMELVYISTETSQILDQWKDQGKSVILVAAKWEHHSIQKHQSGGFQPASESSNSASTSVWKLWAILAASDPLRPEASGIIKAFQKRGIQTWMISGDNPRTANAVAAKVGISPGNVIAGVLPAEKATQVQHLQRTLHKTVRRGWFSQRSQQHNRNGAANGDLERQQNISNIEMLEDVSARAIVAMVGDGINDAPALTVADVGIAIGSGSDIAISSAEFVLVASNLKTLLTLVDLSRMVFRRIYFNFGWALVYNLAAVPVAAGAFYFITRYDERGKEEHLRLDPVWASLAMALSSVSVVCSSLLMRTKLPVVGFRPSSSLGRKRD